MFISIPQFAHQGRLYEGWISYPVGRAYRVDIICYAVDSYPVDKKSWHEAWIVGWITIRWITILNTFKRVHAMVFKRCLMVFKLVRGLVILKFCTFQSSLLSVAN